MAYETPSSSHEPTRTITVEREPRSLVIKRHDAVIAATNNALLVHGEAEAPVYYVPRSDVYMEHLAETGDHAGSDRPAGRRYWSVVASGGGIADAVWAIDHPTGDLAVLDGHLGFRPEIFNVTVG